jgi:hypothetical protein
LASAPAHLERLDFPIAGIIFRTSSRNYSPIYIEIPWARAHVDICQETKMAKIAKTADRKKIMDTSKSTDCPKCGKPTRIAKRVKDRERNIPGGIVISCSACEFYEKL